MNFYQDNNVGVRRTKSLDRRVYELNNMNYTKSGYLQFKEKDGSWVKHWFCLQNATLCYYKDHQALIQNKDYIEAIDLSKCLDISEFPCMPLHSLLYGFAISTAETQYN